MVFRGKDYNQVQEFSGVTEGSWKMTTSKVNFEENRREYKMRKSEKYYPKF